MNNDLISREALRKKLQYVYSCEYIGSKSKEGIVSDIIDEIDNAPTVSFMISPDYVAGLQNHNKELIKQLEEVERPQGEWIIVDDCEQFIAKCSVCGRIEDSRMVKDYPFCHCGARMTGSDMPIK